MFDALILPEQTTAHHTGLPLIIDSFAGGGGASTGIELALGRSPDVAINHDPVALAMHSANHPDTLHLTSSVYAVDPADLVRPGQRVGLAWFSPDCKHHSKAKGGKPLDRNIRDLAWVVVHYAERIRPEIIMLENVEEFQDWCPLTADNKPDLTQRGATFAAWVKRLKRLGYRVQWRQLRACDYGAPTIRKRLFLIARRDGRPIVWPDPTHGAPGSPGVIAGARKPWRTAAEIIDWSIPCPSIFDRSEQIMAKYGIRAVRPLADNTLRRIARGVMRYVIEAAEPFVVNVANSKTTGRGPNVWSQNEPVRTLTSSPGFAVVVPSLLAYYGDGEGGLDRSQDPRVPLTTVTTANRHALIAAFLAQHNGGPRMENAAGRAANAPLSTLTTRGTQQQIVAAHMVNMHGTSRSARDAREPLTTITAGGGHAALVAAFLCKYYGKGDGQPCTEPMHTLTTHDRFGVVTVQIGGEPYVINDIGMRMLTPREQFRAQGFPDSYIIDRGGDGQSLTKTQQTHKCGNSVCPPLAEALVRANCQHLMEERIAI